MFRSVRTS